jgi:hypothetical protein
MTETMANDRQCARIAGPVDPTGLPLAGDCWTLHLAKGWEIVPAERPGDWELRERWSGQTPARGARAAAMCLGTCSSWKRCQNPGIAVKSVLISALRARSK